MHFFKRTTMIDEKHSDVLTCDNDQKNNNKKKKIWMKIHVNFHFHKTECFSGVEICEDLKWWALIIMILWPCLSWHSDVAGQTVAKA